MRRVSISLGVWLLLALTGCKKVLPPDPVSEEPVFYISGFLDGSVLQLEAGKEGYYMETGYQQSTTGLYNFQGAFQLGDCKDCPGVFAFYLNDNQTRAQGASLDINNALGTGQYAYGTEHPVNGYTYRFTAMADSLKTVTSYKWSFGDNSTSTIADPVHTFSGSGPFDVCLVIEYSSSCADTICNSLSVGDDPTCTSQFTVTSGGALAVEFEADYSGNPIATRYIWDFGDGNIDSVSGAHVVHQYNTFRVYTACLTVQSPNCNSTSCYRVDPYGISCAANYRVQPMTTVTAFSTVQIDYWNDAGNYYSTVHPNGQPELTNFRVLSIAPYISNRQNEQTAKINIAASCFLYNQHDISDSLKLDIRDGVIGVAFP